MVESDPRITKYLNDNPLVIQGNASNDEERLVNLISKDLIMIKATCKSVRALFGF